MLCAVGTGEVTVTSAVGLLSRTTVNVEVLRLLW